MFWIYRVPGFLLPPVHWNLCHVATGRGNQAEPYSSAFPNDVGNANLQPWNTMILYAKLSRLGRRNPTALIYQSHPQAV